MRILTILLAVLALALPHKSVAMTAEGWVDHWSVERQQHVNAKHWIRHHPDGYTYKRWTKLLKHHTRAISFASEKIQIWRYKTTPPNKRNWLCIHSYEGSWFDSGDPYWGGLQMNRDFMSTYAPAFLLRKGLANNWTPNEQMWVAENARASRGYSPWPKTAHYCGLL